MDLRTWMAPSSMTRERLLLVEVAFIKLSLYVEYTDKDVPVSVSSPLHPSSAAPPPPDHHPHGTRGTHCPRLPERTRPSGDFLSRTIEVLPQWSHSRDRHPRPILIACAHILRGEVGEEEPDLSAAELARHEGGPPVLWARRPACSRASLSQRDLSESALN